MCVCVWNIWRDVKLLPWLTELLFLIRFFAITMNQFWVFYQAFIQSPFQLQGAWRLISLSRQRSYGNQLDGSLDANFCTCSVAPGRIQVAAGGHVILCFLLLFNCTVKRLPNFNLRFLTSDHSMAPVRFNWSVFARKMHSTSEFAKMLLSKCVIHAGFVKVAWTPRGKPFQAKNLHVETISELTLLN